MNLTRFREMPIVLRNGFKARKIPRRRAMRMLRALALCSLALVSPAGGQARADGAETAVPAKPDPAIEMMKPCSEGNDPELQAIACTELLTGGRLSGPQMTAAYVFRGKANAARQQLPAAIADFTSALKLDPRAADALYNRGATHALVGRYDLALQDFGKVLEMAPNDADTLYYRAGIYALQGRDDAAIKDLTTVLKQHPEDPLSLVDRGGIYIRVGKFDAAIQDFTALLKVNAKSADSYYNRGRAYFLKGDFKAAAADFDAAMQNRAENPYAAIRLYLARLRAGKPDLKPLQEAVAKYDPEQWPLPLAALMLGKVSEADLLQAIQVKDPAVALSLSCETHFYLGELALAKGDKAAAARQFQAAIASTSRGSIEYIDATLELKKLGK